MIRHWLVGPDGTACLTTGRTIYRGTREAFLILTVRRRMATASARRGPLGVRVSWPSGHVSIGGWWCE